MYNALYTFGWFGRMSRKDRRTNPRQEYVDFNFSVVNSVSCAILREIYRHGDWRAATANIRGASIYPPPIRVTTRRQSDRTRWPNPLRLRTIEGYKRLVDSPYKRLNGQLSI